MSIKAAAATVLSEGQKRGPECRERAAQALLQIFEVLPPSFSKVQNDDYSQLVDPVALERLQKYVFRNERLLQIWFRNLLVGEALDVEEGGASRANRRAGKNELLNTVVTVHAAAEALMRFSKCNMLDFASLPALFAESFCHMHSLMANLLAGKGALSLYKMSSEWMAYISKVQDASVMFLRRADVRLSCLQQGFLLKVVQIPLYEEEWWSEGRRNALQGDNLLRRRLYILGAVTWNLGLMLDEDNEQEVRGNGAVVWLTRLAEETVKWTKRYRELAVKSTLKTAAEYTVLSSELVRAMAYTFSAFCEHGVVTDADSAVLSTWRTATQLALDRVPPELQIKGEAVERALRATKDMDKLCKGNSSESDVDSDDNDPNNDKVYDSIPRTAQKVKLLTSSQIQALLEEPLDYLKKVEAREPNAAAKLCKLFDADTEVAETVAAADGFWSKLLDLVQKASKSPPSEPEFLDCLACVLAAVCQARLEEAVYEEEDGEAFLYDESTELLMSLVSASWQPGSGQQAPLTSNTAAFLLYHCANSFGRTKELFEAVAVKRGGLELSVDVLREAFRGGLKGASIYWTTGAWQLLDGCAGNEEEEYGLLPALDAAWAKCGAIELAIDQLFSDKKDWDAILASCNILASCSRSPNYQLRLLTWRAGITDTLVGGLVPGLEKIVSKLGFMMRGFRSGDLSFGKIATISAMVSLVADMQMHGEGMLDLFHRAGAYAVLGLFLNGRPALEEVGQKAGAMDMSGKTCVGWVREATVKARRAWRGGAETYGWKECAWKECGSVETSESFSKCGRCQAAEIVYCSKECQRAHWKEHKLVCKAAPEKPKRAAK